MATRPLPPGVLGRSADGARRDNIAAASWRPFDREQWRSHEPFVSKVVLFKFRKLARGAVMKYTRACRFTRLIRPRESGPRRVSREIKSLRRFFFARERDRCDRDNVTTSEMQRPDDEVRRAPSRKTNSREQQFITNLTFAVVIRDIQVILGRVYSPGLRPQRINIINAQAPSASALGGDAASKKMGVMRFRRNTSFRDNFCPVAHAASVGM